jgi:hypothetical protein
MFDPIWGGFVIEQGQLPYFHQIRFHLSEHRTDPALARINARNCRNKRI